VPDLQLMTAGGARILLAASMCSLNVLCLENTWSSNQGDFVCNTKSPGCHQVCFNAFNPITPVSAD